jgi:hypothetical protein
MLLILTMTLVLVTRGMTRSTQRLWLAVGLIAQAFDIWLLYFGAKRYFGVVHRRVTPGAELTSAERVTAS